MANNPHKPTAQTRKKVADMVSYGIAQKHIALCMGISHVTLTKYYKKEIETASHEANAQVAGMLFAKCMQGDVTSIIFWLKTKAKWKQEDDSDPRPITINYGIHGG